MSERSPRFTFTDLCVLLASGAVLAFVLIPGLVVNSRSGGPWVQCATNLRQIGQAMMLYANANKGRFPRAAYDDTNPSPTEYTNPLAPNPFGPGGPGPNDVTAATFLLLRTQEITPDVFLCPAVVQATPWDLAGRKKDQVSNFPAAHHLGYSLANPYASRAAVSAGFKWNYTLTSDFPLAADMNPGPPGVVNVTPTSPPREMATANSRNHGGEGQNVLYGDGHVERQVTPFCGAPRTPKGAPPFQDNIYTFGNGYGPGVPGVGVHGPPADAVDRVLLPTSPEGPLPPAPRVGPFGWAMIVLAGVIVLCGAVAIRLKLRRTPRHR